MICTAKFNLPRYILVLIVTSISSLNYRYSAKDPCFHALINVEERKIRKLLQKLRVNTPKEICLTVLKPYEPIKTILLEKKTANFVASRNLLNMSESASKIVSPFMPTLFHLALMKISVPLLKEFDLKTSKRIYKDLQLGNFNIGNKKICKSNKANLKVLFIPAHLRCKILQATIGLHWAVYRWQLEHSKVLNLKEGHNNIKDYIFYWRQDGTIDRIKTAQQLVLNEKISIRERFHIACMYFIKESVLTLWKEIEISCETRIFETNCNLTARFWIGWMRQQSNVHWLQAVKDLDIVRLLREKEAIRYSSFFPLLKPKERKIFLNSLKWTHLDDFKFCLHAATKKEERKILKKGAFNLLLLHLEWPLQSLFLETAEKVWHFLDTSSCYVLMIFIWSRIKEREDFDYCKLFEDFWYRIPFHLKEIVTKCPIMNKRIGSYLKKIRRKRKSRLNLHPYYKIWIRVNGRLQSVELTS